MISNVNFPVDSTVINAEIQNIKDKTFLKAGNPFDLDVIKAERERIDEHLKNRGFYYFSPDNTVSYTHLDVYKRQVFIRWKKVRTKCL